MRYAVLLLPFLLLGCSTWGLPKIRLGNTTVAAPKDVGTAGTIARDEERTTVTFPAGTEATVTDVAAQPATQDRPATPAQRITKFTLPAPTPFELFKTGERASTGTIDTTVASKRIDAASKAPLLYAAIVCLGAAVVCLILKWPAIALLCGIGGVCFGLAWKLADIPAWVGGLFLVAAAAGFFFYNRAEKDAAKTVQPSP
jgi:hypothetical protein